MVLFHSPRGAAIDPGVVSRLLLLYRFCFFFFLSRPRQARWLHERLNCLVGDRVNKNRENEQVGEGRHLFPFLQVPHVIPAFACGALVYFCRNAASNGGRLLLPTIIHTWRERYPDGCWPLCPLAFRGIAWCLLGRHSAVQWIDKVLAVGALWPRSVIGNVRACATPPPPPPPPPPPNPSSAGRYSSLRISASPPRRPPPPPPPSVGTVDVSGRCRRAS